MKNNINIRKKVTVWVMIFAVMGIGMFNYQAYSASATPEEAAAAQAQADQAAADKAAESALAVQAPTTAEASTDAKNAGVSITAQISAFISSIVNKFQAAFSAAKSSMTVAFNKMKAASAEVIKSLKAQIVVLKDKATLFGQWLGKLVAAVVKVMWIAADVFVPKEDLFTLPEAGFKSDDPVELQPHSKYTKNLMYAKKTIEIVKAEPNKMWTEKEKLEVAKQFFDAAGHNISRLLRALIILFDALPDTVKNSTGKPKDWLQKSKNGMALTADYLGAAEIIMKAKEPVDSSSSTSSAKSFEQSSFMGGSMDMSPPPAYSGMDTSSPYSGMDTQSSSYPSMDKTFDSSGIDTLPAY